MMTTTDTHPRESRTTTLPHTETAQAIEREESFVAALDRILPKNRNSLLAILSRIITPAELCQRLEQGTLDYPRPLLQTGELGDPQSKVDSTFLV